MKTDILFIGALDYPNIPRHGDSVKNQHLIDYFQKYRTVEYIDTWGWKKKPWILLTMLWKVWFGNYRSIVYSTSNETAYVLTRLFTAFPLQKKIIYFMIGGYTPIKILQGVYKAKPYRKVDKIIVEADGVKSFYEQAGVYNSLRVYNFKPYTFVPDTTTPHTGQVKFVFLSRLTKLKGVFLILEAVHTLQKMGYNNFVVDYYGSISPDIEHEFKDKLKATPLASYKGFLNMKDENNYSILADYDAMLFPTMHPTEGFPGVIADAAIAGVPVISANWNYAEELVGSNGCGYVIPVGDLDALVEKMKYVIDHREENEQKRSVCVKQAEHYQMSNVLSESLLKEIGI